MAPSADFYEVLGVGHAADERAIKSAYFALVRKHPPETRPEEFQRIREAYEVLSNPRSRADYDAVREVDRFGDATTARLRSANEAMESADWPRAQRELDALLAEQPQLGFARDLLGMAYLNAHRPADALREFSRLVDEQPSNAVYHLHKGYAHYAQSQYTPALDCYREARRLDPHDTRVLVATADCMVAQKQYEPALEELERAIHLDGAVDFQDFVFFMRRVQIQLLRERSDLAEAELDQLVRLLPDDADTRKYVAARLSSLASDLFAMKRSADANRLLSHCGALDPARTAMAYTFPARVRLSIAALPDKSRAWLAATARAASPLTIRQLATLWPLVYLLATTLMALGIGWLAFAPARRWDGVATALALVGLSLAPLLVAGALHALTRVWRSPYGRYTTVHPCHLLQVDIDVVTVWPLVNLHEVSLTHLQPNGVYQYTLCRLDFAGVACDVRVRGQQASIDWANRLLEQRRKLLDLMSAGLIEAQAGFDLVPPALLVPARGASSLPSHSRGGRWSLVALACGLGAFAVALPHNRTAGERRAWSRAHEIDRPSAYRDYLATHPHGPNAAAARAALATAYASALERHARSGAAEAPAGPAVAALVRAVAATGGAPVQLRYLPSLALPPPEADVADPAPALTPAVAELRQRRVTSALGEAFDQVVGDELIELDDGGVRSEWDAVDERLGHPRPGPVVLEVRYRVSPANIVFRSFLPGPRRRIRGLRFDWELRMLDAGGHELYRTMLPWQPDSDVEYRSFGGGADDDTQAYDRMADTAFHDFGRAMARELGAGDDTLAD
jgi:curved DNA-binding protein CbpA